MRLSIKIKFSFLIFSLILLLMGSTSLVILNQVEKSLLNEIKLRGEMLARNIALNSEDPLATNDDLYLVRLCTGAMENEGVVYTFVLDEEKIIRAHNDISLMTKKYGGRLTEFSGIYRVTAPIVLASRKKIGEVHVGLNLEGLRSTIKRIQIIIVLITLAGLVIGIVGAFSLSGYLTTPIKSLVGGVLEIAKGNFDQRIRPRSKDEIGDLTYAFNRMAQSLKEKELIKGAFRRYVSHQVADEIFKDPDKYILALKGERKRVTVLFADIRGFTPLSERLPPEEVVEMLNETLAEMTTVIFKYEGTIDKFIGDCIMAVFGAPIAHRDDVSRALKAAIEIQEGLIKDNVERIRRRKEPIMVGIGINVGEVVVGNIGSKERLDYTVIGDSVNLASRLQEFARGGEIIISDMVYNEVKDHFEFDPPVSVRVRGKAEPVNVYNVRGIKS